LDCVISENTSSENGAGLCGSDFSNLYLENCKITDNKITNYYNGGGGGLFSSGEYLNLKNCLISGNISYKGAGICCEASKADLINCTIAGNSASFGGGVRCYNYSDIMIKNSIIIGNAGGAIYGGKPEITYSCIEGFSERIGNIDVDPGFYGWGSYTDIYVDKNYTGFSDGSESHPFREVQRVLSLYDSTYKLFSDSPCIGAGELGENMGADTGFCKESGNTSVTLHIAEGEYDIGIFSLVENVSIEGAGELKTVLSGTLCGVRSDLKDFTVRDGNIGGIIIGMYDYSYLRNISILSNQSYYGGGVNCDGRVSFHECTIIENNSFSCGGGVNCSGDADFFKCTISGNTSSKDGGGVCCLGDTEFINCDISGNISSDDGGGVNCSGNAKLIDCDISGNISSDDGGGVNCSGGAELINCDISGNTTFDDGGGVKCTGDADFFMCTISGNTASGDGGGIFCSSDTKFEDCIIMNNKADSGGGVISSGKSFFSNCTLSGNSAHDSGGGINSSGEVEIRDCILKNNSGESGGGVYCSGKTYADKCLFSANWGCSGAALKSNGELVLADCEILDNGIGTGGAVLYCTGDNKVFLNCRITGNAPSYIYGWGSKIIYCGNACFINCSITGNAFSCDGDGLIKLRDSSSVSFYNCIITGNRMGECYPVRKNSNSAIEFYNCIIRDNYFGYFYNYTFEGATYNHCCVDGNYEGTGNINADPEFVRDGYWTGNSYQNKWIEGDYHLKDTSPCIDAGNPDTLYNDTSLPPGLGTYRNDMGIYGGPRNCSVIITSTDILNYLLGKPGLRLEYMPEADANQDGKIDIADMITLIQMK
jgi:parallel beta helix pectate lyase-like protein/polymorphic membrane protein